MSFLLFLGIGSIVLMLILLVLGFPIALIFLGLSFGGLSLIINFDRTVSIIGEGIYHTVSAPNFATLPLFILLGVLASNGGFAKLAFRGLHIITHGIKGGLGIATCYACAFFGAMSGSAAATAAIFAKLAIPEMTKCGYDKRFSAGIISSAGTFASMIPPSGLMILYAILTNQSIGRLFAGGIIPGMITATVYAVLIVIRIKLNPKLVNTALEGNHSVLFSQRIKATKHLIPAFLVGGVVLGGMYGGFFTPTESAAVGCLFVLILGFLYGTLRSLTTIRESLQDTAATTSMFFAIIIFAIIFSRFLGFTRVPMDLANFVAALDVPRWVIMLLVMGIWFLLGMFMIPDGIYVLLIPILFPLLMKLHYDPVWFGIVTIKLCEIANVTPPVGLNIFTIQGTMGKKNISAEDLYMGIWPFVACDAVVLVLMMIFPNIVLWLPDILM